MNRRELLRASLASGTGMLVAPARAAAAAADAASTDGTPAQFLPKARPDPAPQKDDLDKYLICPYCGMDRRYFHKTRMLIHYSNDVPDPLCAIHCAAISIALNLRLDPKAIYVADNGVDADPRPLLEAEKATFLVGSDIPGVMTTNSKMAYGSPAAAAAAQREHGGKLMDFRQALRVAFADLVDDMDGMRRAREERGRRAVRRAP